MSNDSGTIGVKPLKISLYLGTAAADKDFESKELKVYITDFLPYLSGNLEATEVKTKVGTNDDRSDGGTGEATLTNTITAIYADLFTNRTWPPDVRRGEQVLLYNIGDSDTYYWFSQGRDDKLRRCEKFRLAVSDDPAFTKELDNDNTYYFEMNTLPDKDDNKIKQIVISTAKSDGEEFKYLIKIDAVNNTLQINDDKDNLILMESKEERIFMRNTAGSAFELNKKNASMVAVEAATIKAGDIIVLDAPKIVDQQNKDEKVATKEADYINFTAKKGMVINTPIFGIRGIKNEDGKESRVDVTVCGSLFTKAFFSMCNGMANFAECGDDTCKTGESDLSSGVESFIAKSMALFSTENTTDSSEPVEENRPTELKTEFADGHGADELRDDAHFHNTNMPSTTATAYTGATINLATKEATTPENTQNIGDGEAGRHGAAWDQMTAAFDRNCVAIANIRSAIDKLADKLASASVNDDGTQTISVDDIKELTKYADKLGVESRVLAYNSFVKTSHTP